MSDELSDTQIAELAEDVQTLQRDLESLLATTESDAEPVKLKDNAGRLSRMDEMHNQSILLANRNVFRNRLSATRAALTRLDNDAYGYCVSCDETISFPRLKAYPEADMCLNCKSQHEQQ